MSQTKTRIPVVILGAGLTGMSAAFHLGRMGKEFRLFEQLGRPGGHAVTLQDSGYRFDRTGHLLHLRDPEMRTMVLDWIGHDYIEVDRQSRIWSQGTYTRYPFQANTFGLPPQVAYECLHGFVQAHFAKDKPEPKNFEEFCLVHFGEAISRYFMIPYNTRLWGVHPRDITAAWCSRFVPLPKLEDVLAGAVGLQDRELGYNTKFVVPRLGIGQLSEGLARSLVTLTSRQTAIEMNRTPTSIDWTHRKIIFDTEVVDYDVLISSIPLPVLIKLLDAVPDPVSRAAAKLRCTSLYYLDVALNRPCQQPFHWVYVPESKYPFYRVGCYSNFSPAMAPSGMANLYIELADRSRPDLDAVVADVVSALVEMRFIDARQAIEFVRLRHIEYAYVVFDHAYYESLEVILPFLAEAGIVTCGRYGGWNYSSMEDALIFGRQAANQAKLLLGGGS